MANVKRLKQVYTTALTLYSIIRRDSDNYLLDDATGSFASAPADPYVSLTEHGTIKGLYEKDESRTAWTDGWYTLVHYRQIGGSPNPAVDTILSAQYMRLAADTELSVSDDLEILAKISELRELVREFYR